MIVHASAIAVLLINASLSFITWKFAFIFIYFFVYYIFLLGLGIVCQFCKRNSLPQYQATMPDGILYNFCSSSCVAKFQVSCCVQSLLPWICIMCIYPVRYSQEANITVKPLFTEWLLFTNKILCVYHLPIKTLLKIGYYQHSVYIRKLFPKFMNYQCFLLEAV